MSQDAKKDDAVRKAYKYLASFHEVCSCVINMLCLFCVMFSMLKICYSFSVGYSSA